MEERNSQFPHPHRRHRTRAELFKEAYLPYLILLAAAVLIIVFIVGAITRGPSAGVPL